MKKIANTLLSLTAMVMLFSCSSSKQTVFAKRKYTHFKHGDVQIALNKPETKERKNIHSSDVQTNEHPAVQTSAKSDIRNHLNEHKQVLTAPVKQKKLSSIARNNTGQTEQGQNEEMSVSEEKTKSSSTTKSKPFKRQINQVGLVVLAIILPPLAVHIKERGATGNFWIDVLLTLLFWIPGVIFAFLVIYGVA